MTPILAGLLGSLGAGLLTGVGALPVLFGGTVSRRSNDLLLGFAAGVMLSAAFFSLILPGITILEERGAPVWQAAAIAGAGILAGVAAIHFLNESLPHEHFAQGREGAAGQALERIWLFVIAIAIHNLPEGMAVGVGFGGGDTAQGLSLATGIGLQNIPEGLAVAVALRGQGYTALSSFGVALATGLVEPVGGLAGAAALSLSSALLPWGLTFAAGAMIYIISHEIIPETHRGGHQNAATAGLAVGLVVMMFLDVTLG